MHLAASIRDQRAGSIEELNGIATWRMVRAAEHAGVGHFVFASALGASTSDRTRFMRAKALAEQAVLASTLRHAVVAPSVVYAPGDRYLTLLARLALLPAVPAPGRGRATAQPIWADDVADRLVALLDGRGDGRVRHELAGPDTLSHRAIVELALRAAGRPRPVVRVPGRAARAPAARERVGPGISRARHLGRGRVAGGPDDHHAWHGRRAGTGRHPALDGHRARRDGILSSPISLRAPAVGPPTGERPPAGRPGPAADPRRRVGR